MLVFALGSFFLDQLAVVIVLSQFSTSVSGDARWFSLVEQPGSSIIAIILVLGLPRRFNKPALGVVLGAAVSNLVTFWTRGGAVDYIALPFGISTNMADILVTTGLIATAIIALNLKKPYSSKRLSDSS